MKTKFTPRIKEIEEVGYIIERTGKTGAKTYDYHGKFVRWKSDCIYIDIEEVKSRINYYKFYAKYAKGFKYKAIKVNKTTRILLNAVELENI